MKKKQTLQDKIEKIEVINYANEIARKMGSHRSIGEVISSNDVKHHIQAFLKDLEKRLKISGLPMPKDDEEKKETIKDFNKGTKSILFELALEHFGNELVSDSSESHDSSASGRRL